MSTLRQGAVLAAAGALLSVLALAADGRVGPRDLPQLVLALDAQAPVLRRSAADAGPRDGLLVLDGRAREAHARLRPAGSVNVPFEGRDRDVFVLPEGRQVDAVLVVAADAPQARALAQWAVREWGVREVATLEGGFDAWVEAGLPTDEGAPR